MGVKKSDQIDLRYACLYNNACLSFYFGSMFEVVNTLLEGPISYDELFALRHACARKEIFFGMNITKSPAQNSNMEGHNTKNKLKV